MQIHGCVFGQSLDFKQCCVQISVTMTFFINFDDLYLFYTLSLTSLLQNLSFLKYGYMKLYTVLPQYPDFDCCTLERQNILNNIETMMTAIHGY